MSASNPLQRAHALSAQASQLLASDQSSHQALSQALQAYREAANLFNASAESSENDEGVKGTLKLLTVQHQKLARDVERRLNSSMRSGRGGAVSPAAGGRTTGGPIPRRHFSEGSSVNASVAQRYHTSLDNSGHGYSKAGTNSRLSPPHGIPPFAYRPAATTSAPGQIPQNSLSELSPLHSSSSSSEAPEESYINFGAAPDTLDPFSRFWARLDNMLEDISNPVAFTSMPLDNIKEYPELPPSNKDIRTKGRRDRTKSQKSKAGDGAPSPAESFYIVQRGKRTPSDSEDGEDTPTFSGPAAKTPEELELENVSFRASLDTLASHTQSLEQTNSLLKAQLAERDKKMFNAMAEVRKEATRAKQGQEVWKSQILASSVISPRVARLEGSVIAANNGKEGETTALRKRIKELEDEVGALKVESEKQKSHIEKYKDRFDKLKANARAKKEAKLAAAASPGQGSTP